MSAGKINDGGPAFPSTQLTETWVTGQHGQAVPVVERHGGMSLRDWFAGQALPILLRRWIDSEVNGDVAKAAYEMADAMLKAREAQS